jgi:hypothetical protein
MPRFVLLEHDYPQLHWDFMLEWGDALRTWRLLAFPQPGQTVPAEASFDHRRAYLDYEGPVSGNRGQVKRCEGGTFQWEPQEPAPDAETVAVVLQGNRWRGRAVLQKAAAGGWMFTLSP